jgi:hypothetical protein
LWARTDGLAANRPVILLDDAGVALSSGQDPDTIEALGDDTAAFIGAGPAAGRLANAADRRWPGNPLEAWTLPVSGFL